MFNNFRFQNFRSKDTPLLFLFLLLTISISIAQVTPNDHDGDGIVNASDKDNDNDGILDVHECPTLGENGGFELPVISSNFSLLPSGSVPAWDNLSASDPRIEIWSDGMLGISAYEGDQFAEVNANGLGILVQTITGTSGVILSINFAHRARNNNTESVIVEQGPPGATSYTVIGQYYGDTSAWQYHTIEVNIPVGQNTTEIRFSNGHGSVSGNFIDAFTFTACESSNLDTDDDGTPDYLDTDSDNDGCSDADEAYASAGIDGDDGEQYGTSDPLTLSDGEVDLDGKVVAADYTSYTSTTLDNVLTAIEITEDSAPSDVTICNRGDVVLSSSYSAIESLTFSSGSVSTSNDVSSELVYQWYVSSDGGTNYTAISSTTSNNANTNELTLTDGDTEYGTGNLFYLEVSHPDLICTEQSVPITTTMSDVLAPTVAVSYTHLTLPTTSRV